MWSAVGQAMLEDVLHGIARHGTLPVHWRELLQAVYAVHKYDTAAARVVDQSFRLHQEEARVPAADCRPGPVSYSNQVG